MKIYSFPVGRIGTNCYLLCSEAGNCAVIDPGDEAALILRQIKSHGLTPKEILLTHGHFDHIGAVEALQAQLGERLPVYIHPADVELLQDAEKNASAQMGGAGLTIRPDRTVEDGDLLQLDELRIRVIATPGHTRGGVCYQVEDALFTGDTLFAGSIGRTDLYGGSFAAILESIRRLAALEGDYRVLPGHGPESRLEAERRGNPYLR
jgi:glyoxylase-like metal-dependent hydrolase (beta-lactamase superfamily II)